MEDQVSRLVFYKRKYDCESCFDKENCKILKDIKLGFLKIPECPRWVAMREGGPYF